MDLVGGVTSAWLAFGMNSDAEADFVLAPVASGGGGGGALGLELLLVVALFRLVVTRRFRV